MVGCKPQTASELNVTAIPSAFLHNQRSTFPTPTQISAQTAPLRPKAMATAQFSRTKGLKHGVNREARECVQVGLCQNGNFYCPGKCAIGDIRIAVTLTLATDERNWAPLLSFIITNSLIMGLRWTQVNWNKDKTSNTVGNKTVAMFCSSGLSSLYHHRKKW